MVSFLTNVNVAALLASVGLNSRVVACERTYPPSVPVGLLLGTLRRITYSRAARVVMQSREGVSWLNSRIPSARGIWIPNPVVYPLPSGRHAVSPEALIQGGRKLLLAVGRMDAGKQFDELLRSFASVHTQFSDWDLAILGEGPERSSLERLAAALNIGPHVRFPGQVDNPSDWYLRANLFVLSSRYEGFPNALAEAMAHGCAAVSYDCDTGPRDIIRHGYDGLLVTPVGDVPALAKALRRLMSDDTERQHMAARAVEVRERFSTRHILQMWDELLTNVAEERQGS